MTFDVCSKGVAISLMDGSPGGECEREAKRSIKQV